MSKNFKMTIFLILIFLPISWFQMFKYIKENDPMKPFARDIYIPGGSDGEKIWTFYFGFDDDIKKLENIDSFTDNDYYDTRDSSISRFYDDRSRIIRLNSVLDDKYWYHYPVAFDKDFRAVLLSDSRDAADYCRRINSLLKKDAEIPLTRSFAGEFIMFHLNNHYNDFRVLDEDMFKKAVYDGKHKELKFKKGEEQWTIKDLPRKDYKKISDMVGVHGRKLRVLQTSKGIFPDEKPGLLTSGSFHLSLPILQTMHKVDSGAEERVLLLYIHINRKGQVKIEESEVTGFRKMEERYIMKVPGEWIRNMSILNND